jgi:pimeloyl-ACP methyl ester carboxylesterase
MSLSKLSVFVRSRLAPAAALAALLMTGWAQAQTSLVPAYAELPPKGPAKAQGVVIYSHGRSLTSEDSASPSPAYLKFLAKTGWDAFRFNRPSSEDTLEDGAGDLARRAARLKAQGYRRVIVTGQSFGAFLSILAAQQTKAIDGIVATAPAAFGSYFDSYDSWQRNATELYVDLARLHHTRILLAFFHGDDYDPGGRGVRARAILNGSGNFAVILDQPRDLVGHLAAASPQFVQRYGACLAHFLDATLQDGGCAEGAVLRPAEKGAPQIAAAPQITDDTASLIRRVSTTSR